LAICEISLRRLQRLIVPSILPVQICTDQHIDEHLTIHVWYLVILFVFVFVLVFVFVMSLCKSKRSIQIERETWYISTHLFVQQTVILTKLQVIILNWMWSSSPDIMILSVKFADQQAFIFWFALLDIYFVLLDWPFQLIQLMRVSVRANILVDRVNSCRNEVGSRNVCYIMSDYEI
jgi:hypothetical protein